jgi:aminopeptidase
MTDQALQALARVLIDYSLNVKPGEVVLISGAPVSEPLLVALFQQILNVGGVGAVRLTGEVCRQATLDFSGSDRARYVNPLGLEQGHAIDCSIGIWSVIDDPPPDHDQSIAELPPDGKDLIEHVSSGPFRWVATEYPTLAAARTAGMSLKEYSDYLSLAGLLDSPNPLAAWRAIHDRQQRLCEFFQRAREMRIATAHGTDLTLGIAGRPWFNADGHFNFPDGEVCTAPIEDAVNGVICGSFPVVHHSQRIEESRLKFKDGQVVDAAARQGEQFLFEILDCDPGARRIGELALGTNYNITRYTGTLLLDEKMGGTCHLALGAAVPQVGGNNRSAIHTDIVCDLHHGGWVEIDGQIISRDGRFAPSIWPSR